MASTPIGATDKGPAARRERVRRQVLADGFARVEELAEGFGVSLMTMHRDLDALQDEGWLTKIRGGATANPSALLDAGVSERSGAMRSEKEAIARVAAELVTPGQTLFLDDSTTVLMMVPFLATRAPLTVATNFVPGAQALGELAQIDVHLLGGEYEPRQQSCHGLQTTQSIARLHADLVFMSTTAVLDGQCWHRSERTVEVRRAFFAHSGRSVLLLDHAKIGRAAPHRLCGVDAFDLVVCDSDVDTTDVEDLRERGAAVRLADSA